MGKNTVWLIAVAIFAVALTFGYVSWRMNVQAGFVKIDTRYTAQFNVVETSLFKMRTVIKNKHKCTDEWADNFILVVAEQVKGRPGNSGSKGVGGVAVNVSRESEALGLPQELYVQLSNAIEGNIAEFTRAQNVLTDVWVAHTSYCMTPYHNWLGVSLSDKAKPKPEMITSTDTKSAVKTGTVSEDLL